MSSTISARRRTLAALGAATLIGLFGGVACAPQEDGEGTGTAQEAPATEAAQEEAGGEATEDAAAEEEEPLTSSDNEDNPPTEDVTVDACEVDPDLSWPVATLTVTNNSSETSNYMIDVEFVDASGTRVDEGFAATNDLAAGQTAQVEAQGLTEVPQDVECKVLRVERYASE
ncbi:FxLYD domain-containing protein [Allostreptomyces psammosilenae]|uniref:Uncharacterized protein n=1 Tax=Allostreptomyces psammosilenae TaxID=1892865 RepID=A0A853A5Z0_9ACTN|nr:FxLYD domain-containing protein [Allostreptomyces psammosilenae]NYI08264.1 hypothetical protein [Allostreptomyces psammosilenae]